MNIKSKIKKMVSLVKRDPIFTSRLKPDTDIFSIPIERLIISQRTYHCLKNAKILTVGDIAARGELGLLKLYNLGRKSLNEIKTVLWSLMSSYLTAHSVSVEAQNLKQQSHELSCQSGQWTTEHHENLMQAMGDLEKRLAENSKIIELVLKSSTPSMIGEREGFLIPYSVWKQLLSFTEVSDTKTESILNVLRTSDTPND